ncbi:MAG TPA: S1 RNA-binding domain-containing protein [Bacilli bacterium]|jgi:general stress protein 13|nr:S1 RNA-binding domain-containing protein [Bacilli bacterium]
MEDFSVGSVVKGVVTGIKSYGIFVKLENGYTGLVHISEITDKFVSDINKFANIGENVYVEIKSIDEANKKCILSVKGLNYRMDLPRKINESVRGFTPLKEHLPIWIKEKMDDNH